MRTYVLTENERSFLKAWLERDEKHRLLRDLKSRIRKHHKRLEEDMVLLKAALEKMKSA
jgi:hypothetical protein